MTDIAIWENEKKVLTMTKEFIEREALLARYDAEHVGSPGRARELIVTAPAADVVEVVRCENCVHYHPCQAELTDGSAPDWGICDQPWFNDDENDVDEMFYCASGERREDGGRTEGQ